MPRGRRGPLIRSVLRHLSPEQRPWAERYLAQVPSTDADALYDLLVRSTVAGLATRG